MRIRELQRSKRVEAEVERWPVVLAAAFAVVALPLCFGVGVMFDSADLRFRFLNPVLMISAPETEFASGVLATGLTLLLLAMSVVFARRRRITGVEIALYWFGVAAALIVPVALALVGMTANADLVSNAGRGAWDFANLGSFRPSLIAGSVAALVSGGMLWFVRRERVSGAEVAIYWMGLAWIGSLLAGANGPVATDVSNAMLLTGSIAADASLLVIFFRRTTISRVEVIIYLLAFAGPLGFGSFLSSVSGSGNASNVLAAWTVPVVLGGALLVWAMIERRSRRPV